MIIDPWLEALQAEALQRINIVFEEQFVLSDNRKFIFDFYIKEYNLLLEVNGDFWHANPNQYKLSDIINFPGGVKLVEELWEKDKHKIQVAKNQGFKILTIWETEINANKNNVDEFIQLKIKEIL